MSAIFNNNIEEIFKEYNNKVYRLALSISRNDKDAEDIMQNTFLKIMKNLKYFRNKSSLSTWIYKIAYNESLMHLRKRKSQFKLSKYLSASRDKKPVGLFVNWPKLPDEQLLESEFKERIDTALKRMPIKYRMALLLNNVEDLPLKESAKILGLKINSLKTRLHRAHLRIKFDISNYFKDRSQSLERQSKRCGIWTGFIYNYASGYLGKRKAEAFKRHIKDCPNCNSFLDNYIKAISVTKALECQDLPDELREKIETFILKNKSKILKPNSLKKHLII